MTSQPFDHGLFISKEAERAMCFDAINSTKDLSCLQAALQYILHLIEWGLL